MVTVPKNRLLNSRLVHTCYYASGFVLDRPWRVNYLSCAHAAALLANPNHVSGIDVRRLAGRVQYVVQYRIFYRVIETWRKKKER